MNRKGRATEKAEMEDRKGATKKRKKDEKGVLPAFGPDLCFW